MKQTIQEVKPGSFIFAQAGALTRLAAQTMESIEKG